MGEDTSSVYGLQRWLPLMGRDLAKARSQPVHPVRIKDRRAGLFSYGVAEKFPVGTKIGLRIRDSRLFVEEADDGSPVHKPRFWDDRDPLLELDMPQAVTGLMGGADPCFGMLFDGEDGLEILPIRVEEHGADVLGPRVIDELRRPSDATRSAMIVRHVVKGFAYEDYTAERLREVEGLLCSQPFQRDPLESLEDGDDWVGWRVRREILGRPRAQDDELRIRLADGILGQQGENGSWADSPLRTAYGILHALSVDVSPEDPRVGRAVEWLLNWPELAGRPGMWMLSANHLREWNAPKGRRGNEKRNSFPLGSPDEEVRFVRDDAQQQVMATCARNFSGLCDAMLHASATVAYALCRCGHVDHPRVRNYANSMLQLNEGMFGYFCACWGPLKFSKEVAALEGAVPDFDRRSDEREIALKSMPYRYGRDPDDLRFLAKFPQCPGVHRPDLADTNGWWPYEWRDIGLPDHFAVVGSYWQNADCWAKTNRALTQFPACRGSTTEFFALFQCHLYQTPLGEWNQGFPGGIFQWISEVTRQSRGDCAIADSLVLRLAKLMILKTVPWLREHQDEDGLWNHAKLSCHGGGAGIPAPSARLATYHIVSALNEFALLAGLRPDE